jgi:hypothetical protein
MYKYLPFFISLIFVYFFVSSCTNAEEKNLVRPAKKVLKEPEIIEGAWDSYGDEWIKGNLQIDTLLFFDAGVGARESYGFIDKHGERIFFGQNFSKISFLDTINLDENLNIINKSFIVGHRKLIHKKSNSKDFAGDNTIDIITWAKPSDKELEFKSLEKKYLKVKAKFNEFAMGDLGHYLFTKKNGEELDFGNIDDKYYDFELDPIKNPPFLIFYYDTQYVDPFLGPYETFVIHKLIPISTL